MIEIKNILNDSKNKLFSKKIDFRELLDVDKNRWDENKKLAICISFNPWIRKFFQDYIPEYKVAFTRGKTNPHKIINALKNIKEEYDVFIWSYQENKILYNYLKNKNKNIYRVEDGFIHSVGQYSDKSEPLSLIIEKDNAQSKLEDIIVGKENNYTEEDLKYSKKIIGLIVSNKITKHNSYNTISVPDLKETNNKNILVIGQIEDGISIKSSSKNKYTNLDLLKLAKKENPEANILFKPHPNVLKDNNSMIDYQLLTEIVSEKIHIHDLIDICDHIYTISSLSGFEALIKRKKVTCLGSPFYSHWGLTDDREESLHNIRNLKLTIEELVYCALIKYPLYKFSSIEKTIENIISKHTIFDFEYINKNFLIFDNTYQKVKNELILDSMKDKKIAIITDNSDISNLFYMLKSFSKNIQLFPTSNNVTNIIKDKNLIEMNRCKFIVKAYYEPLNNIENKAVDLATAMAKKYEDILYDLTKNIFPEKISKYFSLILAEDLQDRIFNDCIIYYTLESILENYDYVFFNLDANTYKSNLLNLIEDFNNNFFVILTAKKINLNFFNNILKKQKVKVKVKETNDNYLFSLRTELKKLWVENIYNSEHKKFNKKRVTICANITNKNYAYYPSAKEIIELIKNSNLDLNLIPSSFINDSIFDNYKNIMFDDIQNKINYEIYPLFQNRLKAINNQLSNKISSLLSTKIKKSFLESLNNQFPESIINFMITKINNTIDNIGVYFSFYFEMLKLINKDSIFITTMERSIFSRLTTIACLDKNVYTYGIQPQVISTSKRYRNPIVDSMLVIDELQKENYVKLGFDKNKIYTVGSANIRKHVSMIIDNNSFINEKKNKNILFIMQHSMPEVMINSIGILMSLNSKDFNILLKPHPHQEISLLDNISLLIKNNSNISLLDKDQDTYHLINQSDFIIGLFSSVMYEAILGNKDVIILKLKELDPSIDFTRLNICFEAKNESQLQDIIIDLVKSNPNIMKIRNQRNSYIKKNDYLYTNEKLKLMLNLDKLKEENE